MTKFTKAFLLGAASFAIGFSALIPFSAEAKTDRSSQFSQGYNDDYQDYNESDSSDQGYNDENQGDDVQNAPAGPSLNVSVEMNLSGEYGQMFNQEKDKYEVFLRALNDPEDSRKGSKPARLSIDGGDVTFEKIEDEPKGVLVGISRVGNNYQYFCSGKNVKDGVIKGFPQNITVTLKNGNKPYKTVAGTLRNDSYPNCEVKAGTNRSSGGREE